MSVDKNHQSGVAAFAIATMALAFPLTGCQGSVSTPSNDPAAVGPSAGGPRIGEGTPVPAPEGTSVAGLGNVLRRLSQREYANTIGDLLGEGADEVRRLLPDDGRTIGNAFDNEWELQDPSEALVVGVEQLARDTTARVMTDPTRRDAILGCTPSGPDDTACFESFVRDFGRRAFRRPLESEDVADFMALASLGTDAGDFYVAAEAALSAFLQHPRFLYRFEIGQPVIGDPTLRRLDGFEVASRLSYFLWSSGPDDWLLDEATAGNLEEADSVEQVAAAMLDDPRARRSAEVYHATWLGYDRMDIRADLADPMRAETNALLSRVLFEDRNDWSSLFRAEETFVGDDLAEHYGLPTTGSNEPSWRPYAGTERRGILSHGTFLAPPVTGHDTSPTVRGLFVRSRLLCQEIEPPANLVVDDAEVQAGGECKPEQLAAHASGACQGCHRLTDPIGFGLEQYDQTGRFRTFEADRPQCTVDGRGEIFGPDLGSFVGPGQLGELLAGSDEFRQCMLTQLHRFVAGRFHLDADDEALLVELRASLAETPSFDAVVTAVVTHPSFVFRREAE